MKIEIEIETWGQAHHLGVILTDAEWKFRKNAETDTYGIHDALNAYADFFKKTAKAVVKQAEPLNWEAWDKRNERSR